MRPLLYSLCTLLVLAITILVGQQAAQGRAQGRQLSQAAVSGCARLASLSPAEQARLGGQLAEIDRLKAQQGGLSHEDAARLDVRISALQGTLITECRAQVTASDDAVRPTAGADQPV